MSYQTDCRNFNGYKPCGFSSACNLKCSFYEKRGTQILIIHLGALGAVVRSTALLNPILRKYPDAQITWVTDAPAHYLLKNHAQIARVLTTSDKDLTEISVYKFDVAFVIDKSVAATGILKRTSAEKVRGFIADSQGVIRPATPSAEELWRIGLDDEYKFFINQKSEVQLICEALELDYCDDDYNLSLSSLEKELQFDRWSQWSQGGKKIVVGLNTGCASTLPAKKLSIENHRDLIRRLQMDSRLNIVLLGGPEDTLRNQEIAFEMDVVQSLTQAGLRDGLVSVAACDIVITGDSLGLHMAISQKKYVIAWFGPTCSQEIELYGRGEKVLTRAPCSPCWKRSCQKPVMCYDLVELDDIINALNRYIRSSTYQIENQFGRSDCIFRGSSSFDSTAKLD